MEGGDFCHEKYMSRRNRAWQDKEQSIPGRGNASQCKVKYWETLIVDFPVSRNPATLCPCNVLFMLQCLEWPPHHLSLPQTIGTKFWISATKFGNVPALPGLLSSPAFTILQTGYGQFFHLSAIMTHRDHAYKWLHTNTGGW